MSTNTPWLANALRASSASNIGGGAFGLLFPGLQGTLFYGETGAPTGLGLLNHQLLWGFVVVMGVAFGVAARRPHEHRALLLAGALGKLYACGLWVIAFTQGLAMPIILAAVAIDGVLGAAFGIGYLRLERGTESVSGDGTAGEPT